MNKLLRGIHIDYIKTTVGEGVTKEGIGETQDCVARSDGRSDVSEAMEYDDEKSQWKEGERVETVRQYWWSPD